MPKMNFVAIIDTSSIIWDENDYNRNKHHYYELAINISNLLSKLKKKNLKYY